MKRTFHAACAAIQFLTRIPVGSIPWSEDLLGRSAMFFPLVGLIVGGGAAIVSWLCRHWVNDSVRAVAVLVFLVVITGGLHEDALADVADGLGVKRNREKALEIMRDSRVGSFGATFLALALIARYALLSSLPAERAAVTLITAHILCRWTAIPLALYVPPARREGQGASFGLHVPLHSVFWGTLMAALLVGCLMGKAAVAPVLVTVAMVILSAWFYGRRLGGITGDCLGTTIQVTEIALYATVLVSH